MPAASVRTKSTSLPVPPTKRTARSACSMRPRAPRRTAEPMAARRTADWPALAERAGPAARRMRRADRMHRADRLDQAVVASRRRRPAPTIAEPAARSRSGADLVASFLDAIGAEHEVPTEPDEHR